MFIVVPFYLTYYFYFSIEHKKVKKRSEENNSMPFVRKQYKDSGLTLQNIICVRLLTEFACVKFENLDDKRYVFKRDFLHKINSGGRNN